MLYSMASSVDDQKNRIAPKATASGKPRHRPKALQIEPFDPSELSKKLNGLVAQQGGSSQSQAEESPKAHASGNDLNAPSPRTIPVKQARAATATTTTTVTAKPHKEKEDKLPSPAPAAPPSRRGSIFDHIRFRGSNYTDETQRQEEEDAKRPVPYKHVPKHAAAQFARTTTVEPLAQKASPTTKSMRPLPGPHSMNHGTMSLQEYNKQYRRAQSLCSGRPSGPHGFTRLESTAEVDEEPSQGTARHSQLWNENFKLGAETGRRMSTGNMWGKPDSQSHAPFRRDSTAVGALAPGVNSSSMRRGSASSSGFSDVSSPFARDSGPTSPFRQEFGGSNSPNRQSSDNNSNNTAPPSRRGSLANISNPQQAANVHRVDWSQSDQPSKPRRDSKWGLKNRKPSVGQAQTQQANNEKEIGTTPESEVQTSTSPKSPKSGFLRRFKH
ncbi:hypothetical protein ACJ41O_002245 [Fusarium nematophilum]